MNDNFRRAFEYLMRNEGVYADNHFDPGGATKYGITAKSLGRWRKLGRQATTEEVANLSRDEAALIYFGFYWKPLRCDYMVNLPIATAVFDSSVLFGIGTVMVFVQRVLEGLGYSLLTDGVIGSDTLQCLNDAEPHEFLTALTGKLRGHITSLVTKHPTLAKFEKGWRARVDRIDLLGSSTTLHS